MPAHSGFDDANSRRRYSVIGLIALMHLGLFWMLATGIRIGLPRSTGQMGSAELQVRLLSPNLGPREALAPPLNWDFLQPEDIIVPKPEFQIGPEDPRGIGATAITRRVPPRLDPTHVNEKPQLPHTLGMVGALALELRILVLPDGSVGQAQIIKSTGEPEIDRLAIETVQNSWRYLPASANGRPIEAWTTVIVRFASM